MILHHDIVMYDRCPAHPWPRRAMNSLTKNRSLNYSWRTHRTPHSTPGCRFDPLVKILRNKVQMVSLPVRGRRPTKKSDDKKN